MNNYDIKRLALILAIKAEIDGMKAENKQREVWGHEMMYNESYFQQKANQLRDLAAKHDEQL